MATIDATAAAPTRAGHSQGERIVLVVGDTISFLAFAAIGRTSHGEASLSALLAVAGTAAPFLLGWFAVATPGEAFRSPRAGVRSVLQRTALGWLGAWPLGLALRALPLAPYPALLRHRRAGDEPRPALRLVRGLRLGGGTAHARAGIARTDLTTTRNSQPGGGERRLP